MPLPATTFFAHLKIFFKIFNKNYSSMAVFFRYACNVLRAVHAFGIS